MNWPAVRFEDIYLEPSRNGVYKRGSFHGSGVRIVNMGELFAYDTIDDQSMNRIMMTDSEMDRFGLANGDLLFARRSLVDAGAGKCSIVGNLSEPTTFESSIIRIRIDQTLIQPRFLYYWLKSYFGRSEIRAIVTGTNIKGIRGNALKNIKIPCPSIEVQNSIVRKLKNYDDLIKNNRRRIQLLERAARLLYREWFIHLHFPGHKRATIIDGIPQGWEIKSIADVCETVGGGTPSTKVSEYWNGDIIWITPSDVTKNNCLTLLDSERKITDKGFHESSAKLLPAWTILMTSRASVGFFALMDTEICTNQGFINIIPHEEEMRMYLLFNLMNRVAEIRSNAKGTTYPEINKGRFRQMSLVVPSKDLVIEFSKIGSEIIRQVRILTVMAEKCKQTRDILLPQLMNRGVVT